jgi:transposase
MPAQLGQMLEELRKAEQARDLLSELERRLAGDQEALVRYLTQLDQVAQSLPEADPLRLLVESAVGSARMQNAIKAGSDVSRSRSAIEGEISTLRGAIEGIQARADT